MSIDKKRLYICLYSLLAFLLVCLFIPTSLIRWILMGVLFVSSFLVCILIKKRKILSIHKKEVLFLLSVIGILYVMLFYLTGLKFGFYKSVYSLSVSTIMRHVVPVTIIIVSTEIIRYIFLSQDSKDVYFISFFCCVLIDCLLVFNIRSFNTFNQLIDIVGLTMLPAITFNILYHKISNSYGLLPNIVFRLIISLYIYFISFQPAIPNSIAAIIKLLLPLLIWWFINTLYGKKLNYAVAKKTKIGNIIFVINTAFMLCLVMLISNQFKYGSVVIATPSMSGEINIGDVVIYERLDADDVISIGEVIVFKKNDSLIVHRVDDIEYIDGVIRYYTKGDANEDRDLGYITREDIVGFTDVKVSYIGYPTLWLYEIFN